MEALAAITFGLMIPIVALVTSAISKMKRREALHKERMRAIEMGLADLPKSLVDEDEEKTTRKRRTGIGMHGVIWAAIGGGVLLSTMMVRSQNASSDFVEFSIFMQIWAIPALMVGLGLMLYAYFTKNGKQPENRPPA